MNYLTSLCAAIVFSGAVWATDVSASPCGDRDTTVCTIEMWLEYKHKKNNKEIREFLKSKSFKVLRNTIQYWKRRGGHPPTNVALGSGLTAQDAQLVIDIALKYNDNVDGLIFQSLNPPNYAAIATSAWDDKSETKITPEQLESLRNPALTTEEFHKLYRELTGEENIAPSFY
ncbi:MAG: hypothetical protein G3M78_13800 [Candidatus Nitrohelix vancouverensis]|uniref:Uncharacterized protein n=1 Tax=Candidatus Nitrohelix vancouverensis TaxID=2705534 RepID=A0A7T0C4K5_9BACT|nr:MAG: hypothetical protein G3M78_13800 [Candidatus Nitrohelix vancouverensis]